MTFRTYLANYKILRRLLYVGALLLVLYLMLVVAFRPSHDRVWELGQEALPTITVAGDTVTIHNFRNFDWQKEGSTTPRYETRTYSLDELSTVDVLISHFADFEGLAHIFLSFGFADGEHVVVSFEARREVGEEFSPVLGMLRQFEIIYVVGSEQDIIGLRTDVRDGERVYLYPTVASPEKAKELFLTLADDINDLSRHPRVYNTLLHNCTNEITRRVEDISDVDFPLTWKTVLPGYFDEVLYDMDLIQANKPFVEVKQAHLIDNTLVNRYDATYSDDLRRNFGAVGKSQE